MVQGNAPSHLRILPDYVRMKPNFSILLQSFFDIWFPRTCFVCERKLAQNGPVCAECSIFPENTFPQCARCGRGVVAESLRGCRLCRNIPFHFNRVVSPFFYEGNLRKLIHLYKYNDCWHLAEFFAQRAYEKLCTNYFYNREQTMFFTGDSKPLDFMTYVPVSAVTLREREYNQSKILAGMLGKYMGLECRETLGILSQKKSQAQLDYQQRLVNIEGMVYKKSFSVQDAEVFLVDDVFTTGSTVSECARILKESGARSVTVFTLAITRDNEDYS